MAIRYFLHPDLIKKKLVEEKKINEKYIFSIPFVHIFLFQRYNLFKFINKCIDIF